MLTNPLPRQSPLTDDEMERRAQANLAAIESDEPRVELSGCDLTMGGEDWQDEIEAEIDLIGFDAAESEKILPELRGCRNETTLSPQVGPATEQEHPIVARPTTAQKEASADLVQKLKPIHPYRLKHDLAYQKIHANDVYFEGYKEKQRVRKRKEYADLKALEGKSVRRYNWHEHTDPGFVGYDMRPVLMQRTRQRSYRGVDANTVRPRNDLSHMTAEERAAHKASQAVERQRRRRAKLKEAANRDVGVSSAATACSD